MLLKLRFASGTVRRMLTLPFSQRRSYSMNFLLSSFLLIIALDMTLNHATAAECKSSQYCPMGWSVLRREDGSAHTCDPTDLTRNKCPKQHTCVASKCGLKFCCINDKMAAKLAEAAEEEEESDDFVDDKSDKRDAPGEL